MATRSPSSTAADNLDDAHNAISYASGWINNADTKAGLLAATTAVVVGVVAQQASVVGDVLRPSGPLEWSALIILVCLGACLAYATWFLWSVVKPRSRPVGPSNRFGWPFLADPKFVLRANDRQSVAEEAWGQARGLARIAAQKFDSLRRATTATFVALNLMLVWIVLAAAVG